MGVVDVGKLLDPIPGDSPAGANLEYDAAFLALERAAARKDEQLVGDAPAAGDTQDWNAVHAQAVELLGRTKDLRVVAHLARSLLQRSGVAGFSEGLLVARGLLDALWPALHPQLDPEDDNDPTMRVTALAALTTPEVLTVLQRAPLLTSRALGTLSLADIAPPSGAPDTSRIQGIFGDSPLAALEECLATLEAAQASLQGIEQVFERQTGGRGPDLGSLLRIFHQLRQAVEPRVQERRGVEPGAAASADGSAPNEPQRRSLSGDILSRQDVVRALDKVCLYYLANEPSSPVPLLLERCKRLVTMDFWDVLADLSPESVKAAQVVLGKRADGK